MKEEELLVEVETCDVYEKRFIDLMLSFQKLLERQQETMDSVMDETYHSGHSKIGSVNNSTERRKFQLLQDLNTVIMNLKDWLFY